jgi:hypothetical protein
MAHVLYHLIMQLMRDGWAFSTYSVKSTKRLLYFKALIGFDKGGKSLLKYKITV